ncbi:MAG: YARHG domain-containing protein [Lachnospiraceae bacterium]|nr:YARHG domain-containing protein [Lachnospiraceae bacterium]
MFCRFCGKEIPDNLNFCPKCGGQLKAAEEVKPAAEVKPDAPAGQTFSDAAPVSPAPEQYTGPIPGQHANPAKPAKKKLPGWAVALIIVSAALVSLGLCVGSFFLVSRLLNRETKTEEIEELQDEAEELEADAEEDYDGEDAGSAESEEFMMEDAGGENSGEDAAPAAEESAPRDFNAKRKAITDTAGMGFPGQGAFSDVLSSFLDWTGLQYAYGVHEIPRLTVQEALPMTMQYFLSQNSRDRYRSDTDYKIRVPVGEIQRAMNDLFGQVYDFSGYRYDDSAVGVNIEGDVVTMGEGDWGEVTPEYEFLNTVYYDDGSFTVTIRYYLYDWYNNKELPDNYFVIYDCKVDKGKPEGFVITDVHTDQNVDYASDSQNTGDYILPYSDSRELTEQDLWGLTDEELRLARNEIYARHGRKFKSKELQDYFDSKRWYYGTIEPDDWSEKYLNKYETYNVKFISDYEK